MSFCRQIAPAAAVLLSLILGACGTGRHDATADTQTATATNASALPGTGKPPVIIGDKNFTEQFLLGELYAQALSAQGYTVQLNRNIGPIEVTMQALYSGRLDMYPEYIGIWNSSVAGSRRQFASARAAYLAGRRYARAHGLALLAPSRFSDTGAIAVTDPYSWGHELHAIPDLRKVAPTLAVGAPAQFQQSSAGLAALEQAYGFIPAAFKSLPVGEQYHALDQNIVQAAQVSTTDGQLESGHYTLLADPDRVFGWGQAVPVVPVKVLLAEGPAFGQTIDRVSRLLTLRVMRRLNAAVDVSQQDPARVAKTFLQAHGLVPRPPP